MRVLSLLVGAFSAASLNAADRMEVMICNSAEVQDYVLTKAETEAGFVFQSAGQNATLQKHDTPRFVIRLRDDLVPRFGGELSLHALGRAFVSDGEGYIADVYYPAVEALSKTSQAGTASLIGYTIAHEIGHLLLGPGHKPHGIMRARWSQDELFALAQRSLGFDKTDRMRLQDRLRQNSQGRN
jgi:hypothetical protein